MIHFTATVIPTPEAIRQIRDAVVDYAMKAICLDGNLSTEQLEGIQESIENGFAVVARDVMPPQRKGYELPTEAVYSIAHYLRSEKRISAIKEFRTHTGTSLREGKEYIDRFGVGVGSAELFLHTFL
jgi:ribosomal protein L7/L12